MWVNDYEHSLSLGGICCIANESNNIPFAALILVCYTAVFSVVTQRSSPQGRGGALCDDTKNGCVADYLDIRIISASIFHIFETLFRIDGGRTDILGILGSILIIFWASMCWGEGVRCSGKGSQGGSGVVSATPICCPRNAYASWPNQSLSFDNNQKPIIGAWEFLVPTAQRLGADSLFRIHDYSIVSFDRCRIVPTSCKTIRACDRLEMRQMPLYQLARVACLEIFSR